MSEPNFSINFTGAMLASETCNVGDGLVFDETLGFWRVATSANRASAAARTQAIALTAYGGSAVGKVSYQSAGVLAAEVSGLSNLGLGGPEQLVRMSTSGRLERIASYTSGDDVVGYAEPDGRVHLHLGLPWSFLTTGGTGVTPPSGQGFWRNSVSGMLDAAASAVNLAGGATYVSGVLPAANGGTGLSSPGTSGNVLTSNGTGWVSSPASGGGSPGSPDTSLQYRVNATTFGGEQWWTRTGSGVINTAYLDPADGSTVRGYWTVSGKVGGGDTFPSFGVVRVSKDLANPGSTTIIAYHDGTTSRGALGISGGQVFLGDPNLVWQTDINGNGIVLTGGGGGLSGGFYVSAINLGDLAGRTGALSISGGGFIRNSLGSALQVLRTNAAGTDVEWAAVGGTSPGGSSGQFQFDNAGAFGGTSGLVYDSTNNQPQAPNGYVITNGGNRLIISSAPTATRTWTIPDATDTAVGRATTDTLTNKTLTNCTFNGASATIAGTLSLLTGSIVDTSDAKLTATAQKKHVSTTDATVTTVDSGTISSNVVFTVNTIVHALNSGATKGAMYKRSATFRNAGGTVSQIGTTTDNGTNETDSAWDCTIDFTGTTWRVRVTGAAATSLTWTSDTTFHSSAF